MNHVECDLILTTFQTESIATVADIFDCAFNYHLMLFGAFLRLISIFV